MRVRGAGKVISISGFLDRTIESYNKSAEWNSKKFDGYDWSKYLSKFVSMLNGKKVLDFGCGNGRDLGFFAGKNLDCYGIDYSDELLKIAKQRVPSTKISKMNFFKTLDFPSKHFDGIWACASILHVPQEKLSFVLSETKRVLKDDGVLFISVKKGAGEKFIKDDFGKGERFFSLYSKDRLKKILEKSGLDVSEYFEVPDEKLRVNFTKKSTPQAWLLFYCKK